MPRGEIVAVCDNPCLGIGTKVLGSNTESEQDQTGWPTYFGLHTDSASWNAKRGGYSQVGSAVSGQPAHKDFETGANLKKPYLYIRRRNRALQKNIRSLPSGSSYWSSLPSDWFLSSFDAILTRVGENANPCTPSNPVAMGVTTPVLRSTRPTTFFTFAAV